MAVIANIALGLALILVLITICFGLAHFVRAGGTEASTSNMWMRRRVFAQFLAVVALCAFGYFAKF